ncbi:MAG TPA: aldo/keto reductase [Lactobacillaceae bacterium]|jgi:diketogulonate reductase-like aldo/keto reductase
MALTDTYTLSNGVKIPVIGFGTWQSPDGDVAYQAVKWALEAGYRHIDTAAIYGNEVSVGQAIADSGIAREELFVTTKLWNDAHSFDAATAALDESLRKLGLDYVDLYLIHWPNPAAVQANDDDAWIDANADTWRAMEAAYKAGKTRAIGVSNFVVHHLEALAKTQEVAPMVNQIFLNPSDAQAEVVAYNQAHNIISEAYSPFGTGRLLGNDVVADIAAKYGKSETQILLRWSLDNGFLPLPKSTHEDYIKANTDVFDFTLADEDLDALNALDGVSGYHTDADKAKF